MQELKNIAIPRAKNFDILDWTSNIINLI